MILAEGNKKTGRVTSGISLDAGYGRTSKAYLEILKIITGERINTSF